LRSGDLANIQNVYEEEDENGVPCHEEDCSDSDDDDVMYHDNRLVASSAARAAGAAVKQLRGRPLKWDKTTLAL